jgi:hypothetical protein
MGTSITFVPFSSFSTQPSGAFISTPISSGLSTTVTFAFALLLGSTVDLAVNIIVFPVGTSDTS